MKPNSYETFPDELEEGHSSYENTCTEYSCMTTAERKVDLRRMREVISPIHTEIFTRFIFTKLIYFIS